MLKNEFPLLVGKVCPCAELVLIIPICRSSYSRRRSTLTDLQRSKALLSGARVYLHIPLYSLSRPGKHLDAQAWQGTVCICATRVGYQSPKQGNCLLGMVRKRMKC